jgi:hypothetical protein
MNQTPITDRPVRPYHVSKAGSKIPPAWRKLPSADSSIPECKFICPAENKLPIIRWSASVVCVYFSAICQKYISDALNLCNVDTRIYLLTSEEETEEAKKFAKGLEPRLRTLIRTTQYTGPCSIFDPVNGLAWTTTNSKKTWRITLSDEQCKAYHERFLYTFWHECSTQHHLAGENWVSQTGQGIESPFNVPIPINEKLYLLSNDDQGFPLRKVKYLISDLITDNQNADLILTNRNRDSFNKLESLVKIGTSIKANTHELPAGYIENTELSALIMFYNSIAYRLILSSEQTAEFVKWVNATNDWYFLCDVVRSTQPEFLNATFQLEHSQDIVPGKQFPNGIKEIDLGAFKTSDFEDYFDDKLRIEKENLEVPPQLAVEIDYKWRVKAPQLDDSFKKISEYNEWEKITKSVNSIKLLLIKNYQELIQELENIKDTDPEYKKNDIGGAILSCQKYKLQLDELNPEKNKWKYGQAPNNFDPIEILRQLSQYYAKNFVLIEDHKAYKKWIKDTEAARTEYIILESKINQLFKEIKDCDSALESEDSNDNHKSIKIKKEQLTKDHEKNNSALKQMKTEMEAPAPASIAANEGILDKREDLIFPNRPIPIVGELNYSDKYKCFTLAIKYVEEIEPAKVEIIRLKRYYSNEIKLAKKSD